MKFIKNAGFIAIAALGAALLLTSHPANAQDSWRGPDKTEHFLGSFVLGAAAGGVFPDRPWAAFGAAMVPGVLKELIDSRQPGNKFSGKDLVADALGAALGVRTTHWLIRVRPGNVGVAYRTEF
jgi:uncharacterized protein YfiM (DUF2279 family)